MNVVSTFKEAARDYRRRFPDFVLASAIVLGPSSLLTPIAVSRWKLAGSGIPLLPAFLLDVVGAFGGVFTLAAVTLLAADLRRGGHWSWRRAWAGLGGRVQPVFRASVAGGLSYLVADLLTMLAARILLGDEALVGLPTDRWVQAAVVAFVRLSVLPVVGLAIMVAVLERPSGGFRAIGGALGILRKSSWRKVMSVWLAAVPAILASSLHWGLEPPAVALVRVLVVWPLALPLYVLVSLSVYCHARAWDDDAAESLSAALEVGRPTDAFGGLR